MLGFLKRANDDSRSVSIVERMYVFTLLMVLNVLWLRQRLSKLLMKQQNHAEKEAEGVVWTF